MVHGKSEWAKDSNEEDRVEKLIRSSGCWDNHLTVVDCMTEHKDWRKCQEVLSAFRECMIKSRPQQPVASQKETKEPSKQQADEKKN
ncbi:hypothetical protein QR680_001180 [Steinernema hermaphroditum]|uniref:CHCH domain-containing protein n=1 Tax=Steinernema hermaphroditum TaxID=289476 RepID=A0AA39LFD4_9BILA|nr:hypothetical protein QR680_001180 [Steinernema hermaphroditum]